MEADISAAIAELGGLAREGRSAHRNMGLGRGMKDAVGRDRVACRVRDVAGVPSELPGALPALGAALVAGGLREAYVNGL
jgi:hypothetical protein